MKLLNIHNCGRTLYLFNRDESGKQIITSTDSFFPYYYEYDEKGTINTYDNKKAIKKCVKVPLEVTKYRKNDSPESDVLFVKRYMIDRVPEIEKTVIKYIFIDIEIQTVGMPNVNNPVNTISCISVYNSLSKDTQTWYLNGNYTEKILLQELINYLKKEKPDLLLAWNVAFDYTYLYNRLKKEYNIDFAKAISPINQSRLGEIDDVFYPAGISILDYLSLFKKVYNREQSYALDYIAQAKLGETAFQKVDFSKLTIEIKEKNINDIKRMIKLEEKYKLIPYFDEVRRMSKCLWEDMYWNSRMIDQLVLTEAKQRKIVLPRRPLRNEDEETDETFEGAYRRADTGRYEHIWKVDLGSAYPQSIIDFCLDTANIVSEANVNGLYSTIFINNVGFNQNVDAILPAVAKKMLIRKAELKSQLKLANPETQEAQDLQIKYDAQKGIVNSLFGVTGLKMFRLFDMRVASSITFLIRDLLHYVEEKSGLKIVYIDTDSLFIESTNDPTEQLNQLVQEWAKINYNKDKVDIAFECEGYFDRLLIVALCRYCGYLVTKSGTKKEIKGIEAKRKDSTVFLKKFQTELIEMILDNKSKEEVQSFIDKAKEEIKKEPIENIAFPCKIASDKEYKNIPIFIRALRYTQDLIEFEKNPGDLFYYIYVKSFGTTIKLANRKVTKKGISETKQIEIKQDKDVLAFDETEESKNLLEK